MLLQEQLGPAHDSQLLALMAASMVDHVRACNGEVFSFSFRDT
jgi:hypothetical protein